MSDGSSRSLRARRQRAIAPPSPCPVIAILLISAYRNTLTGRSIGRPRLCRHVPRDQSSRAESAEVINARAAAPYTAIPASSSNALAYSLISLGAVIVT